MSDSFDLLVVGGGLVGSAIAWGAARQGARVGLLDEGDTAFRASRGNFGLVWVQGKGANMPAYARWTLRSSELWPELAGDMAAKTGLDVALRQPGGLIFCLSEAELEQRAALIQRMHNESGDIGTRIIHRDELRAMVPAIGDRVVGAAYCPRDGHASPLYTLRALQQALVAAGGTYLPNHMVDRIDPTEGSFTVQAGANTLRSGKIVIAAGLGAARLAPMVGLDMPVTPLRGQILVTERMRPFLDYPGHTIRQTAEGSVMLGDSHEDVGFNAGTTAAAMHEIAARNLAALPCLADATVVRVWGALRVMTPDGFPVYDQSETHPGAFSAACHSGVTLAGAHALALAPAILAGALPQGFETFSSRRFHVQAA
ncbi:Opine oxidase subunit B [Rhodovastum atsumiense]|uniref:FAD-binding oxidoreductase n=1 Tax=Rhodovastum atsumiense TaxID=504468 RepID=A0A5M6INY2_9PROT|nr:FAD-dependent oxidoreductase [Rhodovastum atsumiense]KAA5609974.1 FAD-binding oxidoreductase [Rhodovastum atsumiense]CAH2598614.1 Opine oxidase subunit B [Rhodovastum atsumiense]